MHVDPLQGGLRARAFGLKKDGPSSFEVTPGQKIDFGDLALARGGVITGRVLDAAGDPLADVTVGAWRLTYVTPASGRVMRTRSFPTNDRGEFRLYRSAAGAVLRVRLARCARYGRGADVLPRRQHDR